MTNFILLLDFDTEKTLAQQVICDHMIILLRTLSLYYYTIILIPDNYL